MHALGGILVTLLVLAFATIGVAGLAELVARSMLHRRLAYRFWASLLTGTGVVLLLVVVVVLLPPLLG